MGVKGIERLECITVFTKSHLSLLLSYIYFVLNSVQFSGKKKIENVTVRNYWKESLLSILCFTIHGKGSSENGLILNCETEVYLSPPHT